jgi:hypothetical protein
MDVCPKCMSEVPDTQERCQTCGNDMGFPNVKEAAREKDQLNARYLQAIQRAPRDGCEDSLARFEERMRATCAVVNVKLDFLHSFLTNDKALYTTYRLALKGQIRVPADRQNDRERRTVEERLFGSYGEQIRYAALSVDGSGPVSYGAYSMRLRELTIAARASLLEDNSYHFVKKHDIRVLGPVPDGYKAVWEERHKLAICKLADRLSPTTSDSDHAKILLFSEGNYSTDSFIEVHVYGSFDSKAIDSVKGCSATRSKAEKALLSGVKDILNSSGRSWVEE